MDKYEQLVKTMKHLRGIVSLDDDVYDLYSKDDLINMLRNARDDIESAITKIDRTELHR